MDQHTVFELKNGVLARSVELILLDGVGGVLSGKLAFQLHGHHWDTIKEQDNINAVFVAQGVVELPGAVEDIGGILGLAGLVDGGLRLPEHGPELDAPIGKTLAQHFQEAHHLHFPAKTVDELSLAVGTVDFLKPLPLLELAGADEGEECAGIQSLFPVKGGGVALLIAAICSEVFLNILLKAFFFYIKIGHFTAPLTQNFSILAQSINLSFTNTNAAQDATINQSLEHKCRSSYLRVHYTVRSMCNIIPILYKFLNIFIAYPCFVWIGSIFSQSTHFICVVVI